MLKGLLSWSNLKDSAGRRVADYALEFSEGTLDWKGKLLGMFATFCWATFMFIATVAATAMSWIADPSWLDGLADGYEDLTKTLFSVVNPIYIAVMTFVILMVVILASKAKSTSSKFSKEDINRVTSGMGIMLVVCILVANPFALLRTGLSVAQAVVEIIAGDDAPSSFSVDALIRQPTMLIAYGKGVPESCADIWSRGGNKAAHTCAGQTATATEITVIISALAVVLAVLACGFALMALWKFTVHLSVAVIAIIVIPWVAASSIARRRQLDGFARHGVTIGAHMLMAIIVQVITIAGPTVMAKLLSAFGEGSDWSVLQMLLLMVMWVFLTGFLFFATRRNGALSRTLKTDAHATLASVFGGSTTVNKALNKMDVQGARPLEATKKIVTGTAAMVNKGTNAFRNGKPVQDDVTDAQRQYTVTMPKTRVFSVGDGSKIGADENTKVNVASAADNAVKASTEKGKKSKTAKILRAGSHVAKYLTAQRVVERAEQAALEQSKQTGEPIASLPVNFSPNDVKALGAEVMDTQKTSEAPRFGGRSPRTVVEETVVREVEEVIRSAKEIGQVANISLERVSSSGKVVDKMSATDLHRALRDSRGRRGSLEASILNGGGVSHSDDDAIRMTVSYTGAKVSPTSDSGSVSRGVWKALRASASAARSSKNALLGASSTRGDVRDGWSSGDALRAFDEVDRYHAAMKARASGGSPSVRVDIPDTDESVKVRATPSSVYGPVTAQYGLGFGDRID